MPNACMKCYKREECCRCDYSDMVFLDDLICDDILNVNKNGIKTLYCCEGHDELNKNHAPNVMISLSSTFDISPHYTLIGSGIKKLQLCEVDELCIAHGERMASLRVIVEGYDDVEYHWEYYIMHGLRLRVYCRSRTLKESQHRMHEILDRISKI